MYKVQDIINILEEHAPLALQEDWDNSGLQVGDRTMEVTQVLITLDITLEVVKEAIAKNCNMIVSHHPLIFGGLKSLTGKNYVERCVLEAIRNNVAIYSAHTNLDSVMDGVSGMMAQKLGLQNCKVLDARGGQLVKLKVYVPMSHLEQVRSAMFEVGAGFIGNYDSCSFSVQGEGTFRALDGANPFVGAINELHKEEETALEVVLPSFLQNKIVAALKSVHPYEEVAFDVIQLKNNWDNVGYGMVGDLQKPMEEYDFLLLLKKVFNLKVVCHSPLRGLKVERVVVMGGSGSAYLKNAIAEKADFFVTGDVKYHDFFLPEGHIVMADIGHYESEQYTKNLIKEVLIKKITTFVPLISDTDTNYVKYC